MIYEALHTLELLQLLSKEQESVLHSTDTFLSWVIVNQLCSMKEMRVEVERKKNEIVGYRSTPQMSQEKLRSLRRELTRDLYQYSLAEEALKNLFDRLPRKEDEDNFSITFTEVPSSFQILGISLHPLIEEFLLTVAEEELPEAEDIQVELDAYTEQDIFDLPIPDNKSAAYTEHLQMLLSWAHAELYKKSTERRIPIPTELDESIQNALLDRLLNGLKSHEPFLRGVFNKDIVEKRFWTVRETLVVAVYLQYEKNKWLGGGWKAREKYKFISDLFEEARKLQ